MLQLWREQLQRLQKTSICPTKYSRQSSPPDSLESILRTKVGRAEKQDTTSSVCDVATVTFDEGIRDLAQGQCLNSKKWALRIEGEVEKMTYFLDHQAPEAMTNEDYGTVTLQSGLNNDSA